MLNSIQNYKNNSNATLHITIALVIAVLVLAQTLLVYLVLSTRRPPMLEARPDTCGKFELKLPKQPDPCLPARYTPKFEA